MEPVAIRSGELLRDDQSCNIGTVLLLTALPGKRASELGFNK
jgi:hypothetical protein